MNDQRQAYQRRGEMARYLSATDVWALSLGCIIGWGAFVMPGTTFLPLAGPAGTVISMLLSALAMLVIGLNYAYLMKRQTGREGDRADYELRVSDSGIGMSEAFAEHVFTPFERERTSTVSGTQGTGLGMSITKGILDAMGGRIELRAAEEAGMQGHVAKPIDITKLMETITGVLLRHP